jgi:hypothetical protein
VKKHLQLLALKKPQHFKIITIQGLSKKIPARKEQRVDRFCNGNQVRTSHCWSDRKLHHLYLHRRLRRELSTHRTKQNTGQAAILSTFALWFRRQQLQWRLQMALATWQQQFSLQRQQLYRQQAQRQLDGLLALLARPKRALASKVLTLHSLTPRYIATPMANGKCSL